MDELMADGHLETFATIILETLMVASENQRETEETEGGGEKKKSRPVNMTKRSSRGTSMDDKGQVDLKGVSQDEISIKKEGSNVKMINSNMRLYDESE